nr:hypothetical protein [Tanacetum cinerariifolium]
MFSDDQSFFEEGIPKEIYSNPLFDEEIFSMKIDSNHFNAESDLIESLHSHDSPIISSSSKIDSLFDEFAGELTLLKLIPPGINETDCDPEEEIQEKQIEEDQAAHARYWKILACYDDDDDDYTFAIIPNEPVNSLSMGDEHLDTIPTTESDEFIKSSVENLVPNPSESEGEPECDMPFVGELVLLKSIPPGIDEIDCDPEEETHFIKRLFYDNSSLRPPEEFVFKNSDAEIESFSPSLIPVEDSDSLIEEINLSFTPDYPLPPGIKDDNYDYERDILILEELLSNDSLSLPENELMITFVPNQKKSPDLLSHQGLEAFRPSAECPMMIYGKNTHTLDVPLFYFYPP